MLGDTNQNTALKSPQVTEEINLSKIAKLEKKVDQLLTDSIGQEHRLLQVFYNLGLAISNRQNWSMTRKIEAISAFLRYIFLGRTTIFITLGIGGIIALHASFMLSDQNRKLDLENYLNTVNSELGEAQRNSQFVQLVGPLMEKIQVISDAAYEKGETVTNRSGKWVVTIDTGIAARVAVLTQTFQPYRWIQNDIEAMELLKPTGEGYFYTFMSWLRDFFESGFGNNKMSEKLGESKIPVLTAERQSPERGLLLINLHALGIDFSGLTLNNTTFENAYAPGARLDQIDLEGIQGPGGSEPFDLGLATLNGAIFRHSRLGAVQFTLSNLTGANFDAASAPNAVFRGANLDESSFIQSNLEGADFRNAYIGNANFSLADLTSANLISTRGFADANLKSACLVKNVTLVPDTFDWNDYTVPTECCRDSNDDLYPNFKTSNGECKPSEMALSKRIDWN